MSFFGEVYGGSASTLVGNTVSIYYVRSFPTTVSGGSLATCAMPTGYVVRCTPWTLLSTPQR